MFGVKACLTTRLTTHLANALLPLIAALHFWNTDIIACECCEDILSSGSCRALLKALENIPCAFCFTNIGSTTRKSQRYLLNKLFHKIKPTNAIYTSYLYKLLPFGTIQVQTLQQICCTFTTSKWYPEKQRETKLRRTCIVLQSWYLREITGNKCSSHSYRIAIVSYGAQSYRLHTIYGYANYSDVTSVVTRFA